MSEKRELSPLLCSLYTYFLVLFALLNACIDAVETEKRKGSPVENIVIINHH